MARTSVSLRAAAAISTSAARSARVPSSRRVDSRAKEAAKRLVRKTGHVELGPDRVIQAPAVAAASRAMMAAQGVKGLDHLLAKGIRQVVLVDAYVMPQVGERHEA